MNEEEFQEIIRIQQMMSQRLMQERRVDRKIDLLNLINELTETGKKKVSMETLLIEAQINGIPEDETMRLFEELEKDRLTRKTPNGNIERT